MLKTLLVKRKGRKILYKLASAKWNWFLNRYYPDASKELEIIKPEETTDGKSKR